MKKLPAALLALALALALAGCGGEGASEIVQVPLDSLGEVRAMGEKCLEQLSEQEDGLPMSAEIRRGLRRLRRAHPRLGLRGLRRLGVRHCV